MADDLPVYEILARLPIRSLARFRCVCKLWLDYINDSYLETIHIKQPTPMILEQFPFSSNKKKKQCRISFLHQIQAGSVQVQKETVLEFCYEDRSNEVGDNQLILGSCNGLTLICYERDYRHLLMAVINPLSDEGYNLPPVRMQWANWWDEPQRATGIGFDDSTNTLKTVFVMLKTRIRNRSYEDIDVVRKQLCVLVHDSGSGSTTWREIAQIPAYPISGEGVFCDGRLHWLVTGFDWPNAGRKIVWFDVKTEEFGLTEPPKPKGGDYQLVDLNGEVGFAHINNDCIELWVLKKHDEWVLHCGFDLNLVLQLYNDNNVEVSVLGCWNKDGDIMLTCGGGKRLFVYALKTGNLRGLDLQDDDPCEAAEIRMYPGSLFPLRHKCLFVKKKKSTVRGDCC